MTSTFKKGDKVLFVGSGTVCWPVPDSDRVYTVKDTPEMYDGVFLVEHASHLWYRAEYFKPVEVEPREVPGVPEGYRLVRIGKPGAGEYYLDGSLNVVRGDGSGLSNGWAIIEKTTKTERLYITVDHADGAIAKEWVPEGHTYLPSGSKFTVVETQQTREVPA